MYLCCIFTFIIIITDLFFNSVIFFIYFTFLFIFLHVWYIVFPLIFESVVIYYASLFWFCSVFFSLGTVFLCLVFPSVFPLAVFFILSLFLSLPFQYCSYFQRGLTFSLCLRKEDKVLSKILARFLFFYNVIKKGSFVCVPKRQLCVQ